MEKVATAPARNFESLQVEALQRPLWALGSHSQTLAGYLLPSIGPKSTGERVEVDLGDGDRIVGRFHPAREDKSWVVHLFHGLAGSTESGYMLRMSALCERLGVPIYRFNHRGCGEGLGLAEKPYHSGRGEDLAACIAWARERHPEARHLAIGFSLSGSALLNLLSGRRGKNPPDAAISVSAPIDLRAASLLLKSGFNRLYDYKFVSQLRSDLETKVLKSRGELRIPRKITIWDFDEFYTAPLSGFKNREDYYFQCSTWQHLSQIQVPTLLITAEDDPFVPFSAYRSAKLSKFVSLLSQKGGGHMGFISKYEIPDFGRRWLDYALCKAIQKIVF